MSNEEQAVLDFFSKEENLPLALSVAELIDGIRQRLNNQFWRELHGHISLFLEEHQLPWSLALTEDRNTPDCVVGVHLHPMSDQTLFLRLMMEQQTMGENLRIYYGVMWSAAPSPEKANIPVVAKLRESLQQEHFKNNENFLAWNWTSYHPRRKDFLLRYSTARDEQLDEACGLLRRLLLTHSEDINSANLALSEVAPALTVSLDQLRATISKKTV
jgi:hypothetical protein